ncbi:MAG: 2'-5' RNA ligase [Methylophilales bacterium RIFCSPHIGHO2_02_FULL_57_10]|nr:MAG: 2'-5' RNA ligase [Methylophilales bacterium RIFCSPHIGHO2_02_FULL_57_10]
MKNLKQGKSELAAKANLRLFFALCPDTSVRDALHRLAKKRQLELGGRVMPAETLHLTLLFLGETPVEHLPELECAASTVHAPVFNFVIERFAGWRHNGIGYAAPAQAPDELFSLVKQLRACVAEAAFSFDQRAFVPHVTLLRKVEQESPMQPIKPLIWTVREFVLVKSVPDVEGRCYETLGRWLLD